MSAPPCFRCGEAPAETSAGTPLCADCWFKKISKKATGSRKHAGLLAGLWAAQGGCCAYSGVRLLKGGNASLDHRTPTSRGGGHEGANLHWVSGEVNALKANRTHDEFLALLRTIAVHWGLG